MGRFGRWAVACALYFNALLGCGMNSRGGVADQTPAVLLIGASVGQAWRLSEFPERSGDRSFRFRSVAAWQFDKSQALEEALLLPKRKFRFTRTYFRNLFKAAPVAPDIVVLKECAAYFPGDMEVYKGQMKGWVQRVREKKRGVVLATVVPVTRERASTKVGQAEAIWVYNDWIRTFGRSEGIPVLDLEAAVREKASRFLRAEVSTDGLHLNSKGYQLLDACLLEAVRSPEFTPLVKGQGGRS